VKKSSRGRIHNTVVSLAKHEATNKAGEGGQIGSRVQGDLLKGEKKKDIIFYNIWSHEKGATTLTLMNLSIETLSIMTLKIMTPSAIPLRKTTSILSVSITNPKIKQHTV
jgi:hypothetical protein